jgi:hypothetical protein
MLVGSVVGWLVRGFVCLYVDGRVGRWYIRKRIGFFDLLILLVFVVVYLLGGQFYCLE